MAISRWLRIPLFRFRIHPRRTRITSFQEIDKKAVARATLKLPAYMADKAMNANVAVNALAIVALANILGTYLCGYLGGWLPNKYLLSAVYLFRGAAILGFVALPELHEPGGAAGDLTTAIMASARPARWDPRARCLSAAGRGLGPGVCHRARRAA